MIARFILVLLASFVLSSNGDRYQNALKRIQNELDKIESNGSLDWRTKQIKLIYLFNQMNTVLSLKERALQNAIKKILKKKKKYRKS